MYRFYITMSEITMAMPLRARLENYVNVHLTFPMVITLAPVVTTGHYTLYY